MGETVARTVQGVTAGTIGTIGNAGMSSATIAIDGISSNSFTYTPWVEVRTAEEARFQTIECRMNAAETNLSQMLDALTKVCGILADMAGVEPPESEISAIMRFIDSIPVRG